MKPLVSSVIVLVIGIVGLASMIMGSVYSVPDLVNVSYGLPMRWGVNTVETIAGPVDRWDLTYNALVIDLVFWFGLIVIVSAYLIYTRN